MKQLKYILAIAGCLNPAPSKAQQIMPTALAQWRMGIGLAAEYMSGEANTKIRPEDTKKLNYIASAHQQIGKKIQAAPSMELGVNLADNYYLGLFISWRPSNLQATSTSMLRSTHYQFLHHFKINAYTNALIKTGYRLTPQVMLYGLVGPSFASWSHDTDFVEVNPQTQKLTLVDRFNLRKNSIGLGLGAGFEYVMQAKYALSFDYTCHFHRSQTSTHNMNYSEKVPVIAVPPRTIPMPYSGNLIRKIQPSYSTFAVRLTYFFNLG